MSAHLMLRCCSTIGCFFGDLKSKQEGKGPSGEKREYVPPVNRPGCQCNYASFFTHCCVGMKTEQKYSELTVFVFYIMNRFLT
jgi:hypothetical protein